MRVLLTVVAGLCFAALSVCAQTAQPSQEAPATQAATTTAPLEKPCKAQNPAECGVSREDLKAARQAFDLGNKLKNKEPEKALHQYEEAARLVPRNPDYVTTAEMLRQQLAYDHIQRGNQLIDEKRTIEAAAEFNRALELDPSSQFAAERLRDIAGQPVAAKTTFIEPSPEEESIVVRPKPGRQTLHISGDARTAFTQVATAYGLKVSFDASVRPQTMQFDLEQQDFYQAMRTICAITRTFWMPVSSAEVLVAADTASVHKQLDRWILRTFYLPEVSTPQELNDIVNLMRTVFEIRFVTQQPASSTITLRGPAPVIHAATTFLESLSAGRPQVMLDFDAYEVTHTLMENIGLNMPLQFTMFNIPASALAAIAGTSTQDLINQLIASGGINQANSQAISALLAQLQNQQNSIFQNPLITFGGGTTLMGIGIPPVTANFSKNESRVVTLQRVTMRASQGNSATFRLGSRYPILNGSYAPVFNTPQIANVIGNTGYIAPFPSFNYEDLGITVKTKPQVHGTTDVTLDIELDIRALGGQSFNGVPVISQRAYKGVITVKDGEPAVMAGSMSATETKSLQGLPGFSRVPGLNNLLANKTKEHDTNELLIVITPRILSGGETGSSPMIAMPTQ